MKSKRMTDLYLSERGLESIISCTVAWSGPLNLSESLSLHLWSNDLSGLRIWMKGSRAFTYTLSQSLASLGAK